MEKILYVITKGNWGGAQRYVFDLATSLPKDQFKVSVAYGTKGMLAERLANAGIAIIQLTSMQRDISAGADVRSFFELYRLFKKERPDVVHLNSSKAGVLGALAARLAGVKKIIFTAHGWPFREKRSAPARAVLWLASWITAFFSTKVICVSDYDLAQARAMPLVANKAVRIHNGINLSMPFGSGEKIRSTFPAQAKIIGTIGELTKNKNQISLIEEAKNNPQLFIAIVGEGELRKELEAAIQKYGLVERVKLFGFLPAQEALKGFDTFALPSLKEGFPYVLLEARAAGLPIVANRVGGVPEILDSKDLSDFSIEKMVRETMALY